MKRSREGNAVVAPDDLRQRVIQVLHKLVSPLLFESLVQHDTESLMILLAQIRAVPLATDTYAADNG